MWCSAGWHNRGSCMWPRMATWIRCSPGTRVCTCCGRAKRPLPPPNRRTGSACRARHVGCMFQRRAWPCPQQSQRLIASLLASGVGTCVVSLRDVDNEFTESLMRAFYAGVAPARRPPWRWRRPSAGCAATSLLVPVPYTAGARWHPADGAPSQQTCRTPMPGRASSPTVRVHSMLSRRLNSVTGPLRGEEKAVGSADSNPGDHLDTDARTGGSTRTCHQRWPHGVVICRRNRVREAAIVLSCVAAPACPCCWYRTIRPPRSTSTPSCTCASSLSARRPTFATTQSWPGQAEAEVRLVA